MGLTTGAALAYLGHDVCCLDKDEGKIDRLKQGQPPLYEPHLQELIELSNRATGKRNFCALYVWLGLGYRKKVGLVVGWHRKCDLVSELMKTSAGYDCAYHVLFETLPDCGHSGLDCLEVKHLQQRMLQTDRERVWPLLVNLPASVPR